MGEKKYVAAFKKLYPQALVFYQSPLRMALNLLLGIFDKRPLQVIIYRNRKLMREIQALTKDDKPIIYEFMIRMVEYLEEIKGCYRIADITDCISMEYERRLNYLKGIQRLVFSLETTRLRKLEKAVTSYSEEAWFISDVDRKKLGLDSSHCHIIPNSTKIFTGEKDYRFWGRMIFVGRMSVAHNIQPVEYIRDHLWNDIRDKYPNLRFDIIGAAPVKKIKDMDGKSNIHVHGFVPDLYGALAESDVFVAPMFYSAGIQNKILEALAVGVPVVMTENVAESIGCIDKVHYLKACNRKEFLERTFELLGDETLRRSIGTAAKEFIRLHYSPEIVAQQIYTRIDAIPDM